MNTLFGFILALGVLILVHELGHFIFAKLFGVRVLKFSLGFGPKLIGKTYGETEYVLSAFPLGGFVKMYGENPDEIDIPESEKARSYIFKPVWQRFLIVFAGPFFNFVFPVVVFSLLFFVQGLPTPVDTTMIGNVGPDSPAQQAGIEKGDIIISINDKETLVWQDVLQGVKTSDGKSIKMTVKRGSGKINLEVTPKIDSVKNLFGEEVEKRYMVGIRMGDILEYENIGLFESISKGAQQTWFYTYLTGLGIVKLFQQVVPASDMGGPILIAQIAGDKLRAGWVDFLYFVSLLSVNLGLLNLLPVPVLDGGHLVFLSIEGIRKKPMGERAQIIAQQIGMGLLGTLMLFVFYNDIVRMVGQWMK
ncbi:MAG: RIP metalloprotease RseP [Desulfotalea sp.]